MRFAALALVMLCALADAAPQSLGDVARKEKKRRAENERNGVEARVISDSEVRAAPAGGDSIALGSEPLDGNVPEASAGPLAPDFTLTDRNGRAVSLRELRGRPILVDFWATWCAPCRATMPEVERLHQKYGRDLQVVGINLEGKSPEVLAYLDEGRYSFRVLFDSGNWEAPVARSYGVTSIPRTFLIDREGRVVFSGHPNNLREEQIQATLTR